MSDVLPLKPDDPASVDGYRIVGRLGESGQSIVYLADGPAGEPVALKLFDAVLSGGGPGLTRITAEVERLRKVSVVRTAQIIGTGMHGDRPYVVSEYVQGPTLRAAVEREGPLAGAALHRLAIGTITALVSIHQADVVHRDLEPGNVILGPDGPRVIGLGIGRSLEAGATSATRPLGIPAHITPEELDGAPVGPPADMFCWGTTLLFAASGRAPFDGGSMSATMNRIRQGEPDVEILEQDLRGLVAECLDKDPARRPTASNALLRLVGHSQILATMDTVPPTPPDLGSAPPPDPATRVPYGPPGPRRGHVLALAAAGMVIAVVSGGTVYALTPHATTTVVASRPSPTGAPRPTVKVIEAAPTPPARATKDLKPPGLTLTTHENPSDPVHLTSYFVADVKGKTYTTYARDLGRDTFKLAAKDGDYGDPAVSPDGAWLAINPWFKFAGSTSDSLTIVNRATGERFAVPTVAKPLQGYYARWSPDSKRVLLTLYQLQGSDPNKQYAGGFVIVDVATRRATVVTTGGDRDDRGFYEWAPGGKSVAISYVHDASQWGLRFRDLQGRVGRSIGWVGSATGPERFSPSGRSFLTYCPRGKATLCVWDSGTGNRAATVPVLNDGVIVRGWWDENHLIAVDTRKNTYKYDVIDFHGKVLRTLAEIPKKDEDVAELRFSPK
jgi:serine/threonine protein kinase